MAWDFSTEPEFQQKLDWIREFVIQEIEPIDLAFSGEDAIYDMSHPVHKEVIRPLQEQVKAQNLWACHLDPQLGGLGYGQVKLGLMNEILGRSSWAPSVFGCQAPDSGNAEILAHYGTDAQKEHYLEPLLNGEIRSCYSMTEPQAGADPQEFTCRAWREGDEWVIEGEKWFSSNLRFASFIIVMAVTDPDVPVYQGTSMFLVPADTPGVDVIRHTGLGWEPLGHVGDHAYVKYDKVRVPADNLLGGEGQAFKIAQTRLGGGRIHHAMRTIGVAQRCFDMMCERVLSRTTQGGPLSQKQFVQGYVADSWLEILQFRLLVLHAAWVIDQRGGQAARAEIAAVKVATPKILKDVVWRAMHTHGALGVSNEMPFAHIWMQAPIMGIADGPTEVHKVTIARQALKDYEPSPGLFPSQHLPDRVAAARERFAHVLDLEVGNR
jgi:acyl-CoA dehydrogenase